MIDSRFQLNNRLAPSESQTLVSVGRLTEQKGMLDIVQAFVSLPQNIRNNWKMKIYGSGPQEEDINRCIDEYDESSVELSYCPYEKMPEKVYSKAAAVVHGAKWPEPF